MVVNRYDDTVSEKLVEHKKREGVLEAGCFGAVMDNVKVRKEY